MDVFLGNLCAMAPQWVTWAVFGVLVLIAIAMVNSGYRISTEDKLCHAAGGAALVILTFFVQPYFRRIHVDVVPKLSELNSEAAERRKEQLARSSVNSVIYTPVATRPVSSNTDNYRRREAKHYDTQMRMWENMHQEPGRIPGSIR